MSTILLVIHVTVCIFIIFVVLLQVGRGAELGAAFGSMGQANSSRGVTTFVGKLTTFMAVTFMITSFILTYQTSNRAKSSVIDTVTRQEAQQTTGDVEEKKTETATEKTDEAATETDNE
jgi:preprotein translocase subunit SecG